MTITITNNIEYKTLTYNADHWSAHKTDVPGLAGINFKLFDT